MLMTILWGGTYVAAPTYSMTDLIEAFTIDTTSKMINQIFQQYQAYVQFTDLGDDASGTKCNTDTHGPETARYCADGGVYYVKAMTENGNVPNSAMPYGYSGLDGVNIQPWWISAASSKVYRQYHLTFNSSDEFAFTDTLGDLIASNVNNIKGLIGQLPGEWSLPVCDGGKNYFGCDDVGNNWCGGNETSTTWEASGRTSGIITIDHQWVPCACGFQGNETMQFYNNTGIAANLNMENIAASCMRSMAENNNQGYLQINGGMPLNNEITMDSSYTMTMTSTNAKPTTSPVHYV
ncbi:hypothetical protein OEA41_009681 [Lepraria neglecta]|uniref:Uncharacterized protein n=1 Tax=Lepraria neglecta TaxID=209136 RepID=A0AAD9Z256_9LECA|nr:hypothetical protein OEA41_009681 [Lepraria neglecta]